MNDELAAAYREIDQLTEKSSDLWNQLEERTRELAEARDIVAHKPLTYGEREQFAALSKNMKGAQEQIATLRAQLEAVTKQFNEKRERDNESDSPVASCTCLTKSPEIQYHKPGCKYRLIMERDAATSALAEMTEMEQAASEYFALEHAENLELQAKLAEMTKQRDALNTGCLEYEKEIDALRAKLADAERERDETAEKVADLSTRLASANKLYQLTFDNQSRWMDKYGEAQKAQQQAEAKLAVARELAEKAITEDWTIYEFRAALDGTAQEQEREPTTPQDRIQPKEERKSPAEPQACIWRDGCPELGTCLKAERCLELPKP